MEFGTRGHGTAVEVIFRMERNEINVVEKNEKFHPVNAK